MHLKYGFQSYKSIEHVLVNTYKFLGISINTANVAAMRGTWSLSDSCSYSKDVLNVGPISYKCHPVVS